MKLFFTHKPLAMQNNRIVAESYQKLIRRDGRIRKTVGITGFFGFFESFPLFFVVILWFIYALYYILKGNFDINLPPIISFIKICVAENVAKLSAGWCRAVVWLNL